MWKFKVETNWDGQPAIKARAGAHEFIFDEPKSGGGTDLGPNQLQYLLGSLGACFTAMGRVVAKEMGLKIDAVRCVVTAELNPDGLMDKDPSVRPGFEAINMSVDIQSAESDDKLAKWLETTGRRCPVEDVIAHPTAVRVTRKK